MIEYESGMIKCSVLCKWPMLTPSYHVVSLAW
jgi:hypothetical protein